MELFSTYIITPSGSILFSDINVNLEKSKSLISKGIEELILENVNAGEFKLAIEVKHKQSNLIHMYYQNFGDVIVIALTDKPRELSEFIKKVGWKFLRSFGENFSQVKKIEIDPNVFFPIYENIVHDENFQINEANLPDKKLSSVTLLTIPIQYRSIALLILEEKTQSPEILAERLSLSQSKVEEMLNYLRERGYI